MELKFEVFVKIKASVSDVFDAVYNPKKLSSYFTTGGATGPLAESKEVMWDFHDYPGPFPVQVKQSIKDEKIVFEWGNPDGDRTTVEMQFEALDAHTAKVKIKESGWKENQQSLNASYGNCMGWSQMLCCLKVYMETGKNLREFMY